MPFQPPSWLVVPRLLLFGGRPIGRGNPLFQLSGCTGCNSGRAALARSAGIPACCSWHLTGSFCSRRVDLMRARFRPGAVACRPWGCFNLRARFDPWLLVLLRVPGSKKGSPFRATLTWICLTLHARLCGWGWISGLPRVPNGPKTSRALSQSQSHYGPWEWRLNWAYLVVLMSCGRLFILE